MNDQGRKWFDELKTFAAECRERNPLGSRDEFAATDYSQYRIVGWSMIDWLDKHGPRLLAERAMLAHLNGWEKDPFIVITGKRSGLIAAREIVVKYPPVIVCVDPDEFKEWSKSHADEEYRWHVHMWSYFTELDRDTAQRAKQYPLAEGESYWLHEEGTMCGPLFGRGVDHLWKWDGTTPTLLEEAFNHWVS